MHRSARHTTPLPGVELVSMQSDRSFPRHSHDEFGIGIVEAGGQESWSGRGAVEASAGDVITVNPGEIHDGLGRPGAPRFWRMIHLDPAALAAHVELPAGWEFTDPVLSHRPRAAAVREALAALSGTDAAAAEEALILALSGAETVAPAGRPLSRGVTLALGRIADEAALPLTLADLASTAGVSRFQLVRRFAREVGATPHAYLMQHRVKLARRAIRAGVPLAEAALDAGFADQAHMTRAFMRQFGITPGTLRRAV